MHKFNALAFALVPAVGLLCGAASTASAAPVKIGVLETLSGPQASSGQAYRAAVRYAIDQINAAGGWNGEPVQLLEYDNQGGPAGAADKLKAAAADGVQLIVQGASSAIGGQITEDVRKYNLRNPGKSCADVLSQPRDFGSLGLPIGRAQCPAQQRIGGVGDVIRWIPASRKVMDLDSVAIMFGHDDRFGRLLVLVGLHDIVHRLLDVAVLIELRRQPETHARDAIGRCQLHVREVAGDGGVFALGFLQFRKLELGLDPQCQGLDVARGKGLRRDVEVRAPHTAQRRVEAKHPGQCL